MAFKTFTIDGERFQAEDRIDGILINPKLPRHFDSTPNESRPENHMKWWYRAYITTQTIETLDAYYANRDDDYANQGREYWKGARKQWLKSWPSGTSHQVRCLDGGAWDRSSSWGAFAELKDALACAKQRPIHFPLRSEAAT